MSMVRLMDVSKYYAHHLILDNINLHIEKGEFVSVVGPSGCGKSTLLRLVAGLDTVSHGSILINNQCVNKIPPAKRDMAMVFQNYALYPHMTAFENMAYGLKMRGMKKPFIQQKVAEVAAMLQLTDHLHRKPHALSGGQRQRVAMGRAIVRSPAVFLFDEPLSNLDTKLRAEMRYEIKKIHQQFKTTCLYVTHDQTEAMTMGAKVLVLNKGKVEQVASPQMIYSEPASLFVATFSGHYPINFLNATVDPSLQKIVTPIGIEFPLPKLKNPLHSGEEVIIGVRPEHIQVVNKAKPGAIEINIDFIDDMGADKLIKGKTLCGRETLSVRVPADLDLVEGKLALEVVKNKANVFDKKTGLRLGGWHEGSKE